MSIRLHKKSSIGMLLPGGEKLGIESDKESKSGFYFIIGWMIHSVLLYDGREMLDHIIKKQQEKIDLLNEVNES